MKKLILGVADRILIEELLPKTGGRIQMSLVRDMASKLTFTPEEVRDFEMIDGKNGLIKWNAKKEQDVEFEFTPEQMAVLKEGVIRLDLAGSISIQMLWLIEKIES